MLNVDKLIKKFKAIALDIFHYAGNTLWSLKSYCFQSMLQL